VAAVPSLCLNDILVGSADAGWHDASRQGEEMATGSANSLHASAASYRVPFQDRLINIFFRLEIDP
jgi:hypothetical protein